MTGQTCQVLYAKYNSTRRPEYRVTTEICESADGLFVRKRAGEPAAAAHLENIQKNGLILQEYYERIKIVPSEPEEGTLKFPYIKGRTLAEQIDMEHFEKDRFIAQVNEKLDRVLAIQARYVAPFQPTPEFEAIFGRVEIGEDSLAVNPANIDSLLTNFVENDAGLCCIDCEWVCRFPVPVEYIKYRILRYLYLNQVQSLLKNVDLEEMLGWFGFTEQMLDRCWEMEKSFQQYVHGDGWKYIYTQYYKKKECSVDSLERERQGMKNHIQNLEALNQSIDAQNQSLNAQNQSLEAQNQDLNAQNQSLNAQNQSLEAQNQSLNAQNQNLNAQNQSLNAQNQNLNAQNQNLSAQNQNLYAQVLKLTYDCQTIVNSFSWRITKPARATLDAIKRVAKKHETVYLILRTVKKTLRHGPRFALKDLKRCLDDKKRVREASVWPSDEERESQRRHTFPKSIVFSILVPLYNTPEKYLHQMIQSVQEQTYGKWELCLADGSDGEHASVRSICKAYARKDSRIKYRKLKKNRGIAGNTNACIEMATGDYIALFDHDDMLHPSALFENMKAICEQQADFIYSDENTFHDDPSDAYYPHYKPDYSPDTLRSYNYICHLTVFKRSLLDEIGGGFRSEFDGSQDYDMILRLTERARHIVHIPKILYYWRGHEGSVASDIGAKTYALNAAKAAIAEHLTRIGLKGTVMDSSIPSTYKIQYEIEGDPLISVVIPNMDHVDDLKACIDSVLEKSTWKNWEIIVVENNSKNPETFEYYRSIEKRPEVRIVTWEGGFNYPAICNLGAKEASGDYILLLNNDIQVITPDWLEQMLMFAQRSDVGAVGAMLYYPDDTIQHAGVILGIGGVAGHSHKYFKRGDYGYASRLTIAQNLSAVTAACCLIPTHVWKQVDGLDEGFAVAFNDVDLCLRIRKAGYLIVWTPYAEMYHYESKSRGLEDTVEKQKRFKSEIDRFYQRWSDTLADGDPYYNPNLTLEHENFSFR